MLNKTFMLSCDGLNAFTEQPQTGIYCRCPRLDRNSSIRSDRTDLSWFHGDELESVALDTARAPALAKLSRFHRSRSVLHVRSSADAHDLLLPDEPEPAHRAQIVRARSRSDGVR